MAKKKKEENTFLHYDEITGGVLLLQKKGIACEQIGKKMIKVDETEMRKKDEVIKFLKSKVEELYEVNVRFTVDGIEILNVQSKEFDIEKAMAAFEMLEIPQDEEGNYIYKGVKFALEEKNRGLYLEEVIVLPEFHFRQETITLSKLIKDNLNLDHYCQRKQNQWNKIMEGQLIESIINNIAINPIITCEWDGEEFVVDGKQRLTTIKKLIQDDVPFKVFGQKMVFSKLGDKNKEIIENYNIHIVRYTAKDETQITTLFNLYNNQAPLSGDQKARGIASSYVLEKLHEILAHNFISSKCNFTKGDILKGADETILIQTLMVISGFEFKNFSFKEVNRFLEQLTDEKEIDKLFETLNANLDILDSFIEEKHKNLKKINLPMIISTVQNTEDWKNKLIDFLENYESKENYRIHCLGSTSQREHVLGRLEYFKNF